jgi:glycine/D-amino acid oxidase-like deaminating enzyme
VHHDAHGYWLKEAGGAQPVAPASGDIDADVVIIGGGYVGMWTAWQLRERARVVVLEADVCGHGPSGRNGGFCETLWSNLPSLRERFGDERALAAARASSESVTAIGDWCEAEGVDAWFKRAGFMMVSTDASQDAVIDEIVEAGDREHVVALDEAQTQARCASPRYRRSLFVADDATVQPARLALGLRRRLLERGVRLYEGSPVTRVGEQVATPSGSVAAGAVVLAVNTATGRFPGFARALAVASSHIVLTEPVPDVLDELGWTGGEAIADARTLLHYFRTTPDGRIVFGWGGGRMGYGARRSDLLELDAAAVEQARRSLVRFFPQLAGRAVTHAWGGPIDVSPTHLPIFGSRGRVHHGYGFTGNGVGPSYLGGRILASLALDRRDDASRLALVEPPPARFPPEPLRWAGGTLIRRALVRTDAAADAGRRPDPLTGFVASLPRRLGLHLPR